MAEIAGALADREPFDHFREGEKKETDFFFPSLSGSFFHLYFIVLDIFERRGLDGAFCLICLGLKIFFSPSSSLSDHYGILI